MSEPALRQITGGTDPREARTRRVALSLRRDEGAVTAALVRRGWQVVPRLAVADAREEGHVLVLEGGHDLPDRELLEAERWLERGAGGAVVLLLDAPSEAHLRWAASLTPFCLPAAMTPETLASFIDRVDELRRRREAARGNSPSPLRRVTIRPWDAVEIDGSPIFMGGAEHSPLPRRRLRLEVAFPAGMVPKVAWCVAWSALRVPDETGTTVDGLQAASHAFELIARRAVLTIEQPLVGLNYGMGWYLP